MFFYLVIGIILIGVIFLVIKNRTDEKNDDFHEEGVSLEKSKASIDISDEMILELGEMVRAREKIRAVKKLMDETGISLVDAKDYIDRIDEVL